MDGKSALGGLGLLALLAALALGVVALAGCESPAAQREYARADRIRAEAAAERSIIEAQTQAAAERAAVRQMERDAAHGRALDTLPYVVAIGGGLVLAGFGWLVWWDLARLRHEAPRPQSGLDPMLLAYLEHRDRRLVQDLAHELGRPELAAGQSQRRAVIVYPDESRR